MAINEQQKLFLKYSDFSAVTRELLEEGDRLSPSTVHSYRIALNHYKSWCDVAGVWPLAAVEADIARFLAHRETKVAKKTVSQSRSALLSLFAHLQSKGLRDDNPVTAIPTYPFDRTPERDFLRRDELEAMLKAASGHPADYALVVLVAVNGLRNADVCGADIADVWRSDEQWFLKLRTRDPIYATPLPPISQEAVFGAIGDRTSGPLILNRKGNRTTIINNNRTLKRVKRLAGIERDVTHSVVIGGMAHLAHERGARVDAIGEAIGRRDVKSIISFMAGPSGRHPSFVVADALSGHEGQGGILDTADDFLGDVSIAPAIPIVVAGVALEIHLRELCLTEQLEVAARKRGIGAYSDALKEKGAFPKEVWRQVGVWDDLRNKAAHGELASLDREAADGMVRGVRRFIARYPAA